MLIEKLGPIKKCDISLGRETIFLGKNNSGKTYISYLLYGIYKEVFKTKDAFIKNWIKENITLNHDDKFISINKNDFTQELISAVVLHINTHIHERLPSIFNLNSKEFKDTKVKLKASDLQFFIDNSLERELSHKYGVQKSDNLFISLELQNNENEWKFRQVKEGFQINEDSHDHANENTHFNDDGLILLFMVLARVIFRTPNTLYIPAERNGINVFRKELLDKRGAATFEIEPEKQEAKMNYPMPIADYMKYLAKIDNLSINDDVDEKRLEVWEKFTLSVLKGKYLYNEQKDEYFYREVFSSGKSIKYKTKEIPLQIASSSTKSLFGLEYYIKNQFSKGDILFIDEPEMNLDPDNQVNIASLLTLLAKKGVKVIISTHSDYLIRAVTNDILQLKLNKDYVKDEIQAYYFDLNEINALGDISTLSYLSDFDDVNTMLEDQYFSLQDKLSDEGKQ